MAKEQDENVISTGRDELGRFVSKNRLQQAALGMADRLNQALGRQKRLTDGLAASLAGQAKAQIKMSGAQVRALAQVQKGYASQQKHLSAQEKQHERLTKSVMRGLALQQREWAKTAKAMQHTDRQTQRMGSAGGQGIISRVTGGLGSLQGLIVGAVGGYLGVSGLRSLAAYVTTLGRLRGQLQALFDIRPDTAPMQRYAEALASLGEQQPRLRLLEPGQLQAVLKVQTALAKPLGFEGAEKLTGQLLTSLETMQDLRGFAALAGKDIGSALERYSAFDPASFLTALRSIRQQQDEVNKTASTLDDVWYKVKDQVEKFVVAWVNRYGVDLRKGIEYIGDTAAALIQQAGQWFLDLRGNFAWLLDTLSAVGGALNWLIPKLQQTGKFWGEVLGTRPTGADTIATYDKEIRSLGDAMLALNRRTDVPREFVDRQTALMRKEIERLETAKRKAVTEPTEAPKFALPDFAKYLRGAKDAADAAAGGAGQLASNLTDAGKAAKGLLEKQQQLADAMKTTELASLETAKAMAVLGYKEALIGAPVRVADYLAVAAQIQQEINSLSAAAQQIDQTTIEGKQKMLQLEVKRIDLSKQQLETTRKIKEGYLDAIQAQSFGLGAFSKLLISREENIGLALQGGMVRENERMLGAVRMPQAPRAEALRWSTDWNLRGVNTGRTAEQLERPIVPPTIEFPTPGLLRPPTIEFPTPGLLRPPSIGFPQPPTFHPPVLPDIRHPMQSVQRPAPAARGAARAARGAARPVTSSGRYPDDKLATAGQLLLSASRDIRSMRRDWETPGPRQSCVEPIGQFAV